MKFSYKAYDSAGKEVADTIDAPDAAEAREKLRRRGLFVTEITGGGGARGTAPALRVPRRRGRRALKNLVIFSRELAVLVSTGTPVVESLRAIERQTKDPAWRATLADVRQRVEEGAPLSEALEQYPRSFDAVCRSLIAAGESSGQLEKMLNRLAALTRRQLQTNATVSGALIYPILLISVSTIVMTLMLLFVLPRFGGLFETLDSPLPPTTAVLMGLSEFLRQKWWAVFPAIGVMTTALILWSRTQQGQRTSDTLAIRTPQLGNMTRSFATARITRILGVLLESRVPLMEALTLTKQAMSNWHYVDLVSGAEAAVTRGEPVSAAFDEKGLISPSVCEAMRNAEQSGRLAPVLLSVADYLDDENEIVVRSLTTILEPVIMIFLGIVVGFVAVSMFLPLFDLTSMAGGAR